MTQITEAIYTQGVLKPATNLNSPRDSDVRVVVGDLEAPPKRRGRGASARMASMRLFERATAHARGAAR